jgi:hypothetical protein
MEANMANPNTVSLSRRTALAGLAAIAAATTATAVSAGIPQDSGADAELIALCSAWIAKEQEIIALGKYHDSLENVSEAESDAMQETFDALCSENWDWLYEIAVIPAQSFVGLAAKVRMFNAGQVLAFADTPALPALLQDIEAIAARESTNA